MSRKRALAPSIRSSATSLLGCALRDSDCWWSDRGGTGGAERWLPAFAEVAYRQPAVVSEKHASAVEQRVAADSLRSPLKASVGRLLPMTNEVDIESIPTTGKLFSLGQIMLATFLGAPLAGSLLVAQNYRVLQKPSAAWQALVYGLVSTVILFIIAFLLPEKFPNSLLPVIYCLAMRQLVSYLQGDAIVGHYSSGGAKSSWLVAILPGVASLAVLFAFVFAAFMLYAMLQ